ncbi:transcriptional regulator domain-containing protein [Brucella intermedia]|uniref:transcriptional regulator domain-containing protein n=1 Tax=Brucella intermedia TaxID=94625 RepID=UPI003CE49AB4
MEALQDWTSPRFEEEFWRLERGGITFEFLRRNKRYRNDHRQVRDSTTSGKSRPAEAERHFCQRWGVTFPG